MASRRSRYCWLTILLITVSTAVANDLRKDSEANIEPPLKCNVELRARYGEDGFASDFNTTGEDLVDQCSYDDEYCVSLMATYVDETVRTATVVYRGCQSDLSQYLNQFNRSLPQPFYVDCEHEAKVSNVYGTLELKYVCCKSDLCNAPVGEMSGTTSLRLTFTALTTAMIAVTVVKHLLIIQ